MAQQQFSATKKRHDLRKNPAMKEFFDKQRKIQNAARPKQERIETTLEVGNSKVVKVIGPFRA